MQKNIELKHILYLILGLAIIVYAVLFFVDISTQKPFSDDWFMLEISRELYNKPLIEWVTVKDPFNQWRPLPFVLKGLYLRGEVRDLMLYNVFKLCLFIFILIMIYITSRIFFKDKRIALLSMLFFICNPTIIGAVQNVDHIFKLTGTIFFGLAVIFSYLYILNNNKYFLLIYILSFVMGCFSDADVVAIFPSILLLILFGHKYKNISFQKSIAISIVSLLLFFSYLYIRDLLVESTFGGGVAQRQDLLFNYNILFNIIKLLISIFTYTISPYIYFNNPIYITIGIITFIINISFITLAIIQIKKEQKILLLLITCLSFIAMTPFIFIRHVSEIYSLKPSYLLMIVLACSVTFIFYNSGEKYKKFIIGWVVIMLFSGAFSMKIKQNMIIERGGLAEKMVISMKRALPSPEDYSTINLLIGECGDRWTYSDFVNNDLQLVGIKNYFVRYNYINHTLNTQFLPQKVYTLRWDCERKEFIRHFGKNKSLFPA